MKTFALSVPKAATVIIVIAVQACGDGLGAEFIGSRPVV
jgi:hypothetical protein